MNSALPRMMCGSRRHDFYVNYRVDLPGYLAPGSYRLRLTQTDLVAESNDIGRTAVRDRSLNPKISAEHRLESSSRIWVTTIDICVSCQRGHGGEQ